MTSKLTFTGCSSLLSCSILHSKKLGLVFNGPYLTYLEDLK